MRDATSTHVAEGNIIITSILTFIFQGETFLYYTSIPLHTYTLERNV